MIYEGKIEGIFVYLRSVETKDAETILKWRTDPIISKYLHNTENDKYKQVKWIEEQRKRQNDFYFIIMSKDEIPLGTIGLYNIDTNNSSAEFGRWICLSPLAAVESAILIHEFGFNMLGLNIILTRTVKENVAVVNFHKRFGAKLKRDNLKQIVDGFEIEFCEYAVFKNEYDEIKKKNYNILQSYLNKEKK